MTTRRGFLAQAGGALALAGVSSRSARGAAPAAGGSGVSPLRPEHPITIARTGCGFEREPMVRPFGFKGGYLTEEWIVSAYLGSASGKHGIGLGTQSCLWSDAKVFASTSEAGGNAFMFAMQRVHVRDDAVRVETCGGDDVQESPRALRRALAAGAGVWQEGDEQPGSARHVRAQRARVRGRGGVGAVRARERPDGLRRPHPGVLPPRALLPRSPRSRRPSTRGRSS